MNKRWLALGGLAIAILAVFGWLWLNRPLLPRSVRHQVSFVVLYPGKNNPAQLHRSSIKYNADEKVLTYYAMLDGSRLTVSNQATPEAFIDVPQAYDKLVSGMRPYASFDSSSGKVALTRPPNSNNQQAAVTKAHGTLMFVRADHDLTDDQWRKFFNNLASFK